MSTLSPEQAARNAMDRRFTVGAIVAALVFGVLVALVAVNWISARLVNRHPQSLRLDLTATRQHALSEQTRQVLDNLDQTIEVMTVFNATGRIEYDDAVKIFRFRDLISEYSRRSNGKVEVTHIDASDLTDQQRIAELLLSRYETEIGEGKAAVENGLNALSLFVTVAKEEAQRINAAADELGAEDPGLRRTLLRDAAVLNARAEATEEELGNLNVAFELAQVLPNVPQLTADALLIIQDRLSNPVQPLLERYEAEAKADDVPQAQVFFFRDRLRAMAAMAEQLVAAGERIEALDLADYADVRSKVMAGNTALVMTPTDLSVLTLDSVYPSRYDPASDAHVKDERFLGEQALTGAIVSLAYEHPPMVVFVATYPQSVSGERGFFGHVGQRLRAMNFEVLDWNPQGQPAPFGGPPVPMPRPVPAEGQPIAWIIMPPPDPNPMAPGTSGLVQHMRAVRSLVSDGQPVMFITTPLTPGGGPGVVDEFSEAIKQVGFEVRKDELLLIEKADREGNPSPQREFDLVDWNTDHPIGEAMKSSAIELYAAAPVVIREGAEPAWPLVSTPEFAWADTDWKTSTQLPKLDGNEKAGAYAVAAASEIDGRRAIVLSDFVLAMNDKIITRELVMNNNRQLQQVERVVQPGNAEFFVNCVYWLAGQDVLIARGAKSPRAQKFGDTSTRGAIAVKWLVSLGMPLGCIALGVVVWLVRRS